VNYIIILHDPVKYNRTTVNLRQLYTKLLFYHYTVIFWINKYIILHTYLPIRLTKNYTNMSNMYIDAKL